MFNSFPKNLTEEEEYLLSRYQKLRKKKKQLKAKREEQEAVAQEIEKPKQQVSEEAINATEQAKKLLKAGAIKLTDTKREDKAFKRTKRARETDAKLSAVQFQPFTAQSQPGEEDNEIEMKLGAPTSRLAEETAEPDVLRRKPVKRDMSAFDGDRIQTFRRRGRGRGRDRSAPADFPSKGHTIYINARGISEDSVRATFSKIGKIVNVSTEPDKNCAFVTFERMEAADEAIAQMNGTVLEGESLRVSLARRQPPPHSFTENIVPATPAQSGESWKAVAESNKKTGFHEDSRGIVAYDDEDMF